MKLGSLVLVVVAATLLPGAARADVLLDNTSLLTSWNSSSASNFSGNYAANAKVLGMTFATGPTSYDLTSISVAMAYVSGSLAPTMRLSVFENATTAQSSPAGGATATYTQDFSATFNGTQQTYSFVPSSTWNLKANTGYSFWLGTSEVTNAGSLHWYHASQSASSVLGFTQTGGFYSTNGGASYNAGTSLSMMITGNAAPSVPEIDPAGMGSVLALVTGLLGLLERRGPKVA